MKNVDEAADTIGESRFDALPQRVQEALGELAGAAKEGLLALSVGVGLGVLTELMAEEVPAVRGLALWWAPFEIFPWARMAMVSRL